MYHKWDINQYFLFTLKVTSTEKVWQDRHILFFVNFQRQGVNFLVQAAVLFLFFFFFIQEHINCLCLTKRMILEKQWEYLEKKITRFSRCKTINIIMKKTGEWKKECNSHQDNNSVLRKKNKGVTCLKLFWPPKWPTGSAESNWCFSDEHFSMIKWHSYQEEN